MYANEQPRQSKRSMLASLHEAPVQARLVARNTLDYMLPDGTRKIMLHHTNILTFHPQGGFTIDTGGWGTVTTRARLNEFLPDHWRVSTQKGVMCLNDTPFRQTVTSTGATHEAVVSDIAPNDGIMITKQIDAYMKEWRKRGLPTAEESGGDPWILSNDPKVSEGVMLDWVESKYVFRRMYGLALKYAGVPDQGNAYYHRIVDSRDGKLDRIDYSRIRRYIRACLGLAA